MAIDLYEQEDFEAYDPDLDLESDPEFQDILKQLGAGEAQALMQLIKEFKEMVSQGFKGEFEDFVKIKMATAQGDDDINEFQSEDEMIIEPDEMMDIEKQIVPTEMVAEGGIIDPPKLGNPPVIEKIDNMREWRIANPDVEDVADYKGYYERLKKKRKKKQEGGIMDVVEDEEVVETTPSQSKQQMIMNYLRDRGLPITPENIQKAIIEMITGSLPYTEKAAYNMPQMERPSVLPQGMMFDETITERTPQGIATLEEDIMLPTRKPFLYDAPITNQPWEPKQSTMFAAEGGSITPDTEPGSEIGSFFDPSSYFDKQEDSREANEAYTKIINEFFRKFPTADEETTIEDMVALMQMEQVLEKAPDLGILGLKESMDMITPESVGRSARGISRHHFQEGGPVSDEEEYEQYVEDRKSKGEDVLGFDEFKSMKIQFPMAAGGRVPYGLGSLVKKIFKPIKKVGSKLVDSVKKVVKSPLGKAALLYAATAGVGSLGAGKGLFSKGMLKPTTLKANLGSSWGNLAKMFSRAPKIVQDPTNMIPQLGSIGKKVAAPLQKEGIMSSMLGSMGKNPMPWITAAMLGTGLYTKANPGETNLDNVMGNYRQEVDDFNNVMANIRSGETVTPFTTGNVMFPYPNYYMRAANGGRINYKHGGSHWYNPLSWFSSDDVEAKILGEDVIKKQDKKNKRLKELQKELGINKAEGGIMDLGGMEKDYRETGGFVPLGEYEKKDDVPARLSLNEFVMTADAVRGAGNGDVDKGAEVMEDMMETLEAKGKRHRQAQDMFSVSERLSEVVN